MKIKNNYFIILKYMKKIIECSIIFIIIYIIFYFIDKYLFYKKENFNNKKKNILFYTIHPYTDKIGGIIVQYYIAALLDKLGENVRIHRKFGVVDNQIFNKFYDEDFDMENTVVIYSEGEPGNPLNAKYCVRWILAPLGINSDPEIYKTWNKNDLVYYFNTENKIEENEDKIDDIYKFLGYIYINPNIRNYNKKRIDGYCHTFRKSHYHSEIVNIHPEDSFEISRDASQEDYIEIFNKYKYFVSYDPLNFMSIIAALCGCVSIIYPIKDKTKDDWLKTTILYSYLKHTNTDNLYGISYGLEDLKFAEDTIDLVEEQFKDINNYYEEYQVKPFIKDIQNFEENNNTVENIFY